MLIIEHEFFAEEAEFDDLIHPELLPECLILLPEIPVFQKLFHRKVIAVLRINDAVAIIADVVSFDLPRKQPLYLAAADGAFVFQSVYLFADTIENNIKFGRQDASHEEVVEAAKKACCHEFISKLPNGYNTVIGEGGATLSGGEKQRISIARAIMKDAPIIILDEATANVDPENEKELVEAVDALTKEKTIIMIAHRLKTVRHADQIVVVEKGQIVQKGTHEQLMKQEGIYKRFVDAREQAVSWKLAR